MLYIVATPIGNMADITLRALEVLSNVDLILAEDTRKTRNLVTKYAEERGLTYQAEIIRLDDHIRGVRLANIIDQIKSGATAALVSSAGTPQISDPGNLLIQEVVKSGIRVVPIPGPSAVAAILSVANFYAEPVAFYGFLPKKKGRETTLSNLKTSAIKYGIKAAVIYESPRRIIKLLGDLAREFGDDAEIVVGRELTKQFEEVWYGTVSGATHHFKLPKGEFVLLIKLHNK